MNLISTELMSNIVMTEHLMLEHMSLILHKPQSLWGVEKLLDITIARLKKKATNYAKDH